MFCRVVLDNDYNVKGSIPSILCIVNVSMHQICQSEGPQTKLSPPSYLETVAEAITYQLWYLPTGRKLNKAISYNILVAE